MALYLGLLSGTSMDGVDACIVDFADDGAAKLIAHHTIPYPSTLLDELRALMQPDAPSAMSRVARTDAWLGEFFAQAVNDLIEHSAIKHSDIVAIGSHGQTLHHDPHGDYPYSLQLGDPHRIAERTGLTVVADFRRRDIAAGGQGAPLVPPAHAALFADSVETRVIANIGGIANITILPPKNDLATPVRGFDTGPGNTLMDAWTQRHLGQAYDRDGAWAQGGQVHQGLLARLLAEPYFAQAAPKSTGPELFNLAWLQARAGELGDTITAQDVQATLLELSARSLMEAIAANAPDAACVLICGGGAYNTALMQRLRTLAKDMRVESTADYGVEPAWVEAVAFAWLARQTLLGLPGNLPAVTGAKGLRVLGAIYSAH
jgi:anhydro-N-acetylmuramic acid kinase